MEGRGPLQIAKQLKEEQILNPTAYKHREGIKTPNSETADPYHWNIRTVVHILEQQEYIGCAVNFKTYAAHDLIKAIYIGAPDKSSGKRRQSISICYDFVGFIPLDELMKQETA